MCFKSLDRCNGDWGGMEVIYLLGSVVKFTLAAHLPLSVFYGTLPAKVALKKSHFGKQSRTECAPSHIACQSEFAEAPCDITAKSLVIAENVSNHVVSITNVGQIVFVNKYNL